MEAQYLGDPLSALFALAIDYRDRHAALDRAALDAPDADGTDVTRVIEQRDLKLQRTVRIHVGRRTMLDDGLEQRLHVAVAHRRVQAGKTAQGGCIHHREIQLFIGRSQPIEQIEDASRA